ncbi:MAG TPA: ABC transporter ATP-binding protein [Candidatus Paceibacterota bacterium]|nr:ABC transporter ATP-binding protein [Candidatus Paceibacterota bacterium]
MEKKTGARDGLYTKETIRIYAKAAGKYPFLLTGVIVGGIFVQFVQLIQPLFLRDFFNLIAAGNQDPASIAQMTWILTVVAGLLFINWVCIRLHIYSLVYLDARVLRDTYQLAYAYLIRHSYRFFSNQFAGTLTRRVGRFSKSFETIFDGIVMQFLPAAIFIGGALVVISLQNAFLGLLYGGWVVLILTVQVVLIRANNPLRAARAAQDSRVTGALADAIGNQNTIDLFSGTDYEEKRFKAVHADWYRAVLKTWNMDELGWSILGILMVLINIALLFGTFHFWRQGLLTVGDFVLIQSYLLSTFDRVFSINREIRNFNEAFADAGEMVEILKTPHEITDVPNAPALLVHKGAIEFKNVNFTFTGERTILSDFDMAIKAGEKVALVGPSGAGKTTVTKLLLRFYDVTGGEILIDDQNISQVTQNSLRDAIAFVPQEPILFHRTLMENIRYGRRDATDEEVIAAAKKAHCEEFISRTPLGYETFVGERGIKLSGGERQRIAIARAILKDAPILVLDEATSSLDSESESFIQDALAKLMEGKTVIAIAHRLSTVMKMDRIIVIEEGKVVTTGTHDELVKHKGGLYKKLWEIQAGGFI